MTRMVMCIKLGKELPGLKYAPIKGELGQKIYQLDSVRRMQLQTLDHEFAAISPSKRGAIQSEFKVKRKVIETAFADKKAEVQAEERQKMQALDEEAKAQILKLDRGERSFESRAENDRTRKHEDAEQTFEKKKREEAAS